MQDKAKLHGLKIEQSRDVYFKGIEAQHFSWFENFLMRERKKRAAIEKSNKEL